MDGGRCTVQRTPDRAVLPSARARVRPRRLSVAMFSLLIASSALLATPSVDAPSAGGSVAIDTGVGNAQSPVLAVDHAGAFHVAFSDNPAGERGVYYSRSGDGFSWTPSVRIDALGASSYFPRLAVEREPVAIRGRLYAVYQLGTGSNADIWFTVSDGGAAWAPPRRVDSAAAGVSSLYPSVAASNGRVYVAWSDLRLGSPNYQIFVRTSSDGGATWGPEVQASIGGPSMDLQSRVDAKGDSAVIVWRQVDTGTGIISIWSARSDDGGGTWRPAVIAVGPSAADMLRDPDVTLDESGGAYAVWSQRAPTGESHILYSSSGVGGSWSAPVRVDDVAVSANVAAPTISLLAGTVWVAWHDNRGGDSDIWASSSEDGRTWGDGVGDGSDLRVDDTDRTPAPGDDAAQQFNATVRTGAYGVFVTWEDARNGPQFDVYFGSVAASPLVITEIQDEPSSATRVEIYNLGRAPYSMAGVSLYVGATGIDVSGLGSLPARGHAVVGADARSDLVIPLDLGSEGAPVELRRGGEVLASAASGPFGIAPDPLPSESAARYAGTLDYAAAWTRSASPSFGARNAVPPPNPAPPIVLNEVLFYPAAPGERFVELHLTAPQPLDLAGYRIVSDSVFTIPGGTASPGTPKVYLFEGRSPGWFAPLDADSDNVYLYDAADRLLDMVGWTTSHARGTTVARAPSGAGGLRAFDDASAVANGWTFDQAATLSLVDLVTDQRAMADIGTTVQFPLTATNLQSDPEILNVASTATVPWPVTLLAMDATPLADSPDDADGVPDLGILAPGAAASFFVEVTVPIEGLSGDGNTVTVVASAATVPVARDAVLLAIDLYPYLELTRTVAPPTVYLEGTGPPYNEVAQVEVSARGAGLPIVTLIPQDVVFQLDESGSMNANDPTNLRVAAVKAYIDSMRADDRASLIGFASTAWVVNGRPLAYADPMGKVLLRGDADTLACSPACAGATDIDAALRLGNDWLITYGNRSRPRIEILLTDGRCTVGNPPCPNTNLIVDRAVLEGIMIYTVGLGTDVDVPFLQNIATRTGGQFFQARTAQDLIAIYQAIGMRINRTAGIDPDVTDGTPMIEDHVAPYLTVVPGTFYDPATGQPRPPDYVRQSGDRTVLQWNVSQIQINETWSVRYAVTSTRLGVQDVALHPDSRGAYTRWDGSTVFQPFPRGQLEVLRAATPPRIELTSPADGAAGVPLEQSIAAVFDQDMDWPTVQWTISPPLAATPSFIGRVLALDHDGLAECTEYTVQVTQGQDLEGDALVPGPVPNPWRFSTVCPNRVPYTITRAPLLADLFVTVDGANYTAPHTFFWVEGEVHRIEVPEADPLGASRLVFHDWDDGGVRAHDVRVGAADATITATFVWQHRVDLTLVGLQPGWPASVRFTAASAPSAASAHAAWSDWVDDGSVLDVDRTVAGIFGERFVTQDPTTWTVTAPIQRTILYHHQYVVTVRLLGLEGHAVNVSFFALGRPEAAASADLWRDWVDAGRTVRADDTLSLGPRERYRTLDATRWVADGPIEVQAAYRHQFRPRVELRGLDAGTNHTVGATWRSDGEPQLRTGLDTNLFEWIDAGAALRFDSTSTGDPPRYARNSTLLAVASPFDAVILYAPAPAPPPEGNWKPVLALAYTIGILAAGAGGSRRLLDRYVPKPKDGDRSGRKRRWATLALGQKLGELSIADVELKVHRDRTFTRLMTMVPFAAAEASIGAVSYFTGLLQIPESGSWLPLGFWVNTVLLAGGVSLSLAVWRRGYRMTDDALLRLAAARERMAAKAAEP